LQEICDSQEAWWLRKGCQRARCRLIKGLADAFEIPVRAVQVATHLLDLLHDGLLFGSGCEEQGAHGGEEGARGGRGVRV
jgi:hypothetical protein